MPLLLAMVVMLCLKAKCISEPHVLYHGDELQVASHKFSLHIHPRQETCADCEPECCTTTTPDHTTNTGQGQSRVVVVVAAAAAAAADDVMCVLQRQVKLRRIKSELADSS